MKKFFSVLLLSLYIVRCDFGDEILTYIVDIPKEVKNIKQYSNNICEFVSREQGR